MCLLMCVCRILIKITYLLTYDDGNDSSSSSVVEAWRPTRHIIGHFGDNDGNDNTINNS